MPDQFMGIEMKPAGCAERNEGIDQILLTAEIPPQRKRLAAKRRIPFKFPVKKSDSFLTHSNLISAKLRMIITFSVFPAI